MVLDLFTVTFLNRYANKPIYLFGGAGILLIIPSTLLLLYLFVRRIWFGTSVLASPLFQMSTMIFILGFQSILMGLIAELLRAPTMNLKTNRHIPSVKRLISILRRMSMFDRSINADTSPYP